MNIHQTSKILNSIGILTNSNNHCLEEIKGPYENYHKLEKKIDGNWVYGLFIVERQNEPYLEKIKEFDSEVEGAKFFLLKRLAFFYYSEKVSPFKMNHPELYIGGLTFDEIKLDKAMSLLSIPTSILEKGNKQGENRAINLSKLDNTNFIVSFSDSNGKKIHSTLPLSYQRALSFTFRKVYLLHIYEQEISKILKKEGIILTDEDISIFLT